jgi:hypothetical protein
MKLSDQDADLFFRLLWALQFYVNQKLVIVPINTLDEYHKAPTDQKVQVREAVYQNIDLIDSFVSENPNNFSADHLDIISKWKRFISGSFFIERQLKKYAVFIQDDRVYGVLGLNESFDELAFGAGLPLFIETVLLPFKGKITYDGLIGFRNIYFGSGIRRGLKETYMRAKQNNRIIESLEAPPAEKKGKIKPKPTKDWKPELEDLARKAKALRGSVDDPAIYSPAFSLVRASIEFAQTAASDADDMEGLHKALQKVRRAYNKSNTVLSRKE